MRPIHFTSSILVTRDREKNLRFAYIDLSATPGSTIFYREFVGEAIQKPRYDKVDQVFQNKYPISLWEF